MPRFDEPKCHEEEQRVHRKSTLCPFLYSLKCRKHYSIIFWCSDCSAQLHRPALAMLNFLLPDRIPIIIELSPLEKVAPIFPRYIPSIAHPEIPAPIFLLPLHNPHHCRYIAFTSRRILRMQFLFIISICDIDPFNASYWMWINSLCWSDTVLPFLLHLGMHNEQRIVGQMNCYLAFRVCGFFGLLRRRVLWDDAAHSEFSSYT